MTNRPVFFNGRFLTQKLTGVQRNAYEMTRHLLPLLKNAVVLVPKGELNKSYDVKGWPLKPIGFSKGTIWEHTDLPFFLLLHRAKPLLISLTNGGPLFYRRQVVSIMDMTTFIEPAWFDKNFVRYYKWLVPKLARKSLAIFTISHNSKKDIVSITGVPEEKVKVFYCGISEIFSNRDGADNAIIDKLGLKKDNFLLAVSSLDPRKNFKKLIESYLQLPNDIPLVIVGSRGKAFGDTGINNEAANSDRIIFTGYIDDNELKALYQSALCFIYPSLYEGFGIPPLEAMASGCPTIVSDNSSLPEVCGDASLYVNASDTTNIQHQIMRMINEGETRKSLVQKGYENVKRFKWTVSAEKAAKEIQQII